MDSARPIKVAIVGGGCAAVAAAFELTRPEHRGRYEVTIHQLGWRLGGKGASGRGTAGRIEEHGLHLWMGFYENAFRLMRECYAELDRDPGCPLAGWQDAFAPAPLVGVTERSRNGAWSIWKGVLPTTEGLPGDPARRDPPWSVADYVARSFGLLRTIFETIQAEVGGATTTASGAAPASPGDASSEAISRFMQYGELATIGAVVQAIGTLEVAVDAMPQARAMPVLGMLDAIAKSARQLLESRLGDDVALRGAWNVADLTFATLRGIVRSGLMTDPRGFDAIDEYDSREWLRLNGASESALDSGYLRALYDFGFSYENGDPARPRISAGQALRSMLRAFFTYRGSFFWRMQAGMGDVVFAPFYEVLKRRGARFRFFHRLESVKLVDPAKLAPGESPYVESLEFDVQAETKSGDEYSPLVDVGGLPCWPSEPEFDQLAGGDRMRHERWDFEAHRDRRKTSSRTLRVTEDFDLVVLAIGLGAVPYVCRDIVARDPRWRAMVDHVGTVATQAFQIWLNEDMRQLGGAEDAITVSGFVEPFDTWADMRHLIARESWPEPPRALGYFCSVLPDVEADDSAGERVRQNAVAFLEREIAKLWPGVADESGSFRWNLLADANGARTENDSTRFTSQFWKANVHPSDRYVLSLPGSAAYRISPLDETYDNLTIAGDWTDCGFNAGCVEAAFMSGRLAAHALSASPPLEDIVGFDHP